ncbi:MAG: ACT domain-containing protein [Phycisphaerae bacterium]
MSQNQAVLVAFGDDHPGILDDISQFVLAHEAAVLEVSVNNLRAQFTLLMLLQAPGDALDRLSDDLPRLAEKARIQAELRPAAESDVPLSHTYLLDVEAANGGKLLQQVGNLMRVLGINIGDVEQRDDGGSMRLRLVLQIGRQTPVMKLRELLEQLLQPMEAHWDLRLA